jgi:hypothetical protein
MLKKLRYQTGVVALVQFLAGSTVGFGANLISSISSCTNHGTDCVSNTVTSLILIILTAGWYAFLAVLGYAAQDRRSRRLANVLLLAEGATILVALFDSLHFNNIFGLITSLLDTILAALVIFATLGLRRAAKGHVPISGNNRERQRRHTL